MQMLSKLLSMFVILIATLMLILCLMVTVGISKFVAILGVFLAFYLSYLCWNRPRARTWSTVTALAFIVLSGGFLYTAFTSEIVDTNPQNYLIADDEFTVHAREVMPKSMEDAKALRVEYRNASYITHLQYIRLDYFYTQEDFAAQTEAFSQRYAAAQEPFAVKTDGDCERWVYPIKTEQDASYCFAYALDAQNHRISLLYLHDPRLTDASANKILTDWHFSEVKP